MFTPNPIYQIPHIFSLPQPCLQNMKLKRHAYKMQLISIAVQISLILLRQLKQRPRRTNASIIKLMALKARWSDAALIASLVQHRKLLSLHILIIQTVLVALLLSTRCIVLLNRFFIQRRIMAKSLLLLGATRLCGLL